MHLLIDCDTCKKYFHINCLDPPLKTVPKKTKLFGWYRIPFFKFINQNKVLSIKGNAHHVAMTSQVVISTNQ